MPLLPYILILLRYFAIGDVASFMARVQHNRKREETISLVCHPCTKFTKDKLHVNMSELMWSTKYVQSYT